MKRARALVAAAGSISGTFVPSLPKAVAAQADKISKKPQECTEAANIRQTIFLHIVLDPLYALHGQSCYVFREAKNVAFQAVCWINAK
jgi:hypothetical protein